MLIFPALILPAPVSTGRPCTGPTCMERSGKGPTSLTSSARWATTRSGSRPNSGARPSENFDDDEEDMKTAECMPIDSRVECEPGPEQFSAWIGSETASGWWLQAERGPVQARRATGCLLRPQAGDRVLVFAERDEAWILSVLERVGVDERIIDADGPVSLRSRSGNVSIHAGKCVEVRGEEAIELRSARFGLRTGVARLVSRNV